MSLLMKALEKAAKDRDEARAEAGAEMPTADPTLPGGPLSASGPSTIPPAATLPPTAPSYTPGPKSELSLEPIAAATEPSVASPPVRPETPSRPAAAPRSGRAAASREQQAKAATVVRATGATAGGGAAAKLKSPVWIFGIVAVLFGIAYGTYVYLQLAHPSLFLPKPPLAPSSPPPPSTPVGQAPSPVPGTGRGPAAAPGVVAGAIPGAAPATSGAQTMPGMPGAPIPSAGAPVPSAAVVQAEAPDFSPPPPPPAPAPPRAAEKPVAQAPPPSPPPPAPRDTIKVSRSSAVTAVSPLLNNAYAALQSDRRDDAQRAYEQLLRAEPRNVDGLLGLAAIATTEGRSDEATRRYLQILEIDPRHTLAQSGLIGLLGRADPVAAESRLKQLIAREPSAHLHFTLGNLYADQSQWAAAQHSYFQAHHLEPNNPDYAYNLAIGLEHVNQGKLALGFYRRAVELAGATGLARFNVALAQQRISKLASQVE